MTIIDDRIQRERFELLLTNVDKYFQENFKEGARPALIGFLQKRLEAKKEAAFESFTSHLEPLELKELLRLVLSKEDFSEPTIITTPVIPNGPGDGPPVDEEEEKAAAEWLGVKPSEPEVVVKRKPGRPKRNG
jgi:hypothetical protein